MYLCSVPLPSSLLYKFPIFSNLLPITHPFIHSCYTLTHINSVTINTPSTQRLNLHRIIPLTFTSYNCSYICQCNMWTTQYSLPPHRWLHTAATACSFRYLQSWGSLWQRAVTICGHGHSVNSKYCSIITTLPLVIIIMLTLLSSSMKYGIQKVHVSKYTMYCYYSLQQSSIGF